MARGNGRQDIVCDDADRDRLVEYLGRATVRCSLRVYAFAVMSNHLHVVLKFAFKRLAASSSQRERTPRMVQRDHLQECRPKLLSGKSMALVDDRPWNARKLPRQSLQPACEPRQQ